MSKQNKDPRWFSLKKLSIGLKIAIGEKDYAKAERKALAIISLQRAMKLPILDLDCIYKIKP